MFKGITFVLSACLVWGLIFVVPGWMGGFSPLEVALARCFFFGIISCFFLICKGFQHWKSIPWSIWRQATIFALIVNVLYYISLVVGLRYSSAAVIALLTGISPIAIAFYGNWREKECSYIQLILPSLLIVCGLVWINWYAFMELPPSATWEYIFGLTCGVFSLCAWVWFVVANSRFLKQHPSLPYIDWATIMGSVTLIWVLLIGTFALIFAPAEHQEKYWVLDETLVSFLIGGVILGFICSWLGTYLWNLGSQRLPISLAGQLTIFETIFGLMFVYLIEQSLPTPPELIGILAILSGVGLSIYIFSKPKFYELKNVH